MSAASNNGNAPDILTEVKRYVFRYAGWVGLILLFFVPWIISNWGLVSRFPGIVQIATWLREESIPRADPARFSIAVAHLNGDSSDHTSEQLLVEDLKEIKGIQVLRFDRTIDLRAAKPEEAEKTGHIQAQKYLRQSGADVLIWGTVLLSGSQVAFKLYWTTNADELSKWGRYQPTGNLVLPQSFVHDLKLILSFLILSGQPEYQHGNYIVDQLSSHLDKIKALLDVKDQTWDPNFSLFLRVAMASSLSMIGEQTDSVVSLEQSTAICRDLLNSVGRDQDPPLWAWLKNSEGLNLLQIGEREQKTKKLHESVASFRESLTVRTKERFPLDWARTESNLGSALLRIGNLELRSETLSEAVRILEGALTEQDVTRAGWERAVTQQRLSTALWGLGTIQSDTPLLKKAETAIREALVQWTFATSPLLWGNAQLGLGNILYARARLETGTSTVDEAITALENAHKVYTRDRYPTRWANIQSVLGNALRLRGDRDKSAAGITNLKEAVKRLYEALDIQTKKTDPLTRALTQTDFATALTTLGMREEGTKRLEVAVQEYNAALQLITRKEMPYNWARIQSFGLRPIDWRENLRIRGG